ncbi:hypothetical protein [Streptomyces sp. NPDC090026]|uniref:hypothetical protein n=1 Tax=Streptomyces sp. NPDC090026 TaxID=3365923 RepID=UPI00382D82CD
MSSDQQYPSDPGAPSAGGRGGPRPGPGDPRAQGHGGYAAGGHEAAGAGAHPYGGHDAARPGAYGGPQHGAQAASASYGGPPGSYGGPQGPYGNGPQGGAHPASSGVPQGGADHWQQPPGYAAPGPYDAQGYAAQGGSVPGPQGYAAQGAYAGAPHPQAPARQGPPSGPPLADAAATQTWQGETWDTQYQPAVRPQAPAQAPAGAFPQAAAAPGALHPAPSAHPAPAAPAARWQDGGPAPAPGSGTAGVPLPPEEAGPGTGSGAAPGSSASEGYGPATVAGNRRITDAQRARAEGRSPVIPPGMQPAGLTALLALLMAGGAALGTYGLLVPLVLLQAVTAAGWFRLNGMWPARQGIALAFAGGLAADAALLAAGRSHAAAATLGALGVWVLLTLVVQLRSRADADERLYGLMATAVSAALAILAAGHLAADPDAVVVGAVAVAAATLARALPLPGALTLPAALAAAAGAGFAAGAALGIGAPGALLGAAAGGCALIGLRVASYDYPSRFVHMTAGVALPLAVAAPAVYLLGRAVV